MEKQAWEGLVQRLIREGVLRSPQVVRALRRIPRDSFLPERVKAHAALDSPFPIGFGQTISAPRS